LIRSTGCDCSSVLLSNNEQHLSLFVVITSRLILLLLFLESFLTADCLNAVTEGCHY